MSEHFGQVVVSVAKEHLERERHRELLMTDAYSMFVHNCGRESTDML